MALAEQIRQLRFAALQADGASRRRESPACPLCGSVETRHAFRDGRCSLRGCSVCQLFFVHPFPASDTQHARVSRGAFAEIEILDCERRYQGEKLYYDRHFAVIAEECQGATALLDVGCGTGNLLERLASRPQLHRVGIELNAQVAEFARRVSGCEIVEAPFERFRSSRKFDVVTLVNVFSHIPSFDALFRSARAALRPQGKLILRTSEMSGKVSRLEPGALGRSGRSAFPGPAHARFSLREIRLRGGPACSDSVRGGIVPALAMAAAGPQPLGESGEDRCRPHSLRAAGFAIRLFGRPRAEALRFLHCSDAARRRALLKPLWTRAQDFRFNRRFCSARCEASRGSIAPFAGRDCSVPGGWRAPERAACSALTSACSA